MISCVFPATYGALLTLTHRPQINTEIRRKSEEFLLNFFVNRYVLHNVITSESTPALCAVFVNFILVVFRLLTIRAINFFGALVLGFICHGEPDSPLLLFRRVCR